MKRAIIDYKKLTSELLNKLVAKYPYGYNDEDMMIVQSMTSQDGGGLSRIRKSYLSADADLNAATKALLLSSTNLIGRLRSLFGVVGNC